MTYAWLTAGLDRDARERIERTLRGPEPEDPAKVERENAAAIGNLLGMQKAGLT